MPAFPEIMVPRLSAVLELTSGCGRGRGLAPDWRPRQRKPDGAPKIC